MVARLASSGSTSTRPAAEHDRVADGERFERGGHQDAAAYFGIDVDVVGDLQVVDDGLQHLVHFALRRHQANALEAIDDVVLGLTVPGALRLNRRKVIGGLGVVVDRSLHENLAQLFFLRRAAQVIAPQAGLRFEVQLLADARSAGPSLRCTRKWAARRPAARSCANCQSESTSWNDRCRCRRR